MGDGEAAAERGGALKKETPLESPLEADAADDGLEEEDAEDG